MPFKPNDKKINRNGRPKGTPNRLTKELRTALKNILHSEIERLPEHFDQLETKERLELLVKLLPYSLPKIEPTDFATGEPMEWN